MKQLFVLASVFIICCCGQSQAQVYREIAAPTIRRQLVDPKQSQPANQYYGDYVNDSRYNTQANPSLAGLSNQQYLSNNQAGGLQRNTFAEVPTVQPNYNIYQPIPSYNENSYTPNNQQELNQYGGQAPRPVIINPLTKTTTLVPPVLPPSSQQYQPGPQNPGSQNVTPLSPYIPQASQGQQYPVINPSVANQNLNKYEFIIHFSWRLFQNSKRLIDSNSNIVISPLSVQLLLSLIEQASAGTTKYQLQTIIGNSSPLDIGQAIDQITFKRSKNRLKIGSAMFPSHRLVLNETFREIARNSYVDLVPVDFNDQTRTQNIINSWAATSTEDKITNIFSGSQTNADLILTNAVYFDGIWKYPFNQTVVDRFFQPGSQQKDVTYLKQTANLRYGSKEYKGLKIQWLELPYENDDFSMVIMLPNQFKLDELIEKITESYFTEFLGDLESGEVRRVHLRLPKFEMKIQMPLKTILQSMGISDVFTNLANIPYLAQEKVKIDDAQQYVYLKVDEKGTTAAAVTSFSVITLSSSSYDPEEMEFDVNQPFLAVILHKRTRLPIFVAKIINP